MRVDAPSAYVVRRSRLRTGLTLALYSLLPVTAIVIGLQDLSVRFLFFILGVLFEVILLATSRRRVLSAMRREVLFAIDEQGVYLGPDDFGRPATREPWSNIDAIVYFQGRVWTTSNLPPMSRHVGLVQGNRIVHSRGRGGWWLNVRRASAAAARFGGGTPVLKAPFYGQISREWFHTIPLPPNWLAAHARPGTEH
ncbi:hypothetical protein ACGFIW_26195 [Micromonospora sp. NPDC048935]|uniref:hypothetical protein n=1 Tax=Micromonospora sp. NPDC048935 TaxID=3364262 RepID=UPI00371A1693